MYAAHLTPYLSKAQEELDLRIHQSQQEQAVILGKINDQRAEIERLFGGLEHAIQDIDGGVDAMHASQQADVDDLRSQAWQMEQEVAATK